MMRSRDVRARRMDEGLIYLCYAFIKGRTSLSDLDVLLD